MAVDVQILDLNQATTEGYLAWQKLYNDRQHLPTAHPNHWVEVAQNHQNTIWPDQEASQWRFAFVWREDPQSKKRLPVGILPFRLKEAPAAGEPPRSNSIAEKIQWLRGKRSTQGPSLTFSDHPNFGGGPIGSEPTATLMAAMRYISNEYTAQADWSFHLYTEDPSLRLRVETVLNQFPQRSTQSKTIVTGLCVTNENAVNSPETTCVNLSVESDSSYDPFAIPLPIDSQRGNALPLTTSRRLGEQEQFYHQNDNLLIVTPPDHLSQAWIDETTDQILSYSQQTTGRLFVSIEETAGKQAHNKTIQKLSNQMADSPGVTLSQWEKTVTGSRPPSLLQTLWNPQFAGI